MRVMLLAAKEEILLVSGCSGGKSDRLVLSFWNELAFMEKGCFGARYPGWEDAAFINWGLS